MPGGTYGGNVSLAIGVYKLNYLNTPLSVDANGFFNDPTYLTNQIDKDIPGMITTFLDYYDMGYSFHTMAVYGYRKYSTYNDYYLCVHPGWYGSPNIVNEGSDYYVRRVFVPWDIEAWMYKFNLN